MSWTRRTTLIAIAALLLGGCGTDDGTPHLGDGPVTKYDGGLTCSPVNCAGCCSAGKCYPGNTVALCGAGGMTCTPCAASGSCVNGICGSGSKKCHAGNCASGCCEGDTCKPGNTPAACGVTGAACSTCGTGQKCTGGACVCDPANCNGCCQGAVCRPGTANDACGANGKTCAKCSASQTCSNGICGTSAPCNATNCAKGCCAGGTCQPGSTPAACGTSGQSCKTCNAGETCNAGVCINTTSCNATNCKGCCVGSVCQSGNTKTACGGGGGPCKACKSYEHCPANTCTFNPQSKWTFIVYDATLDTSKKWDWIGNAAPDPYVIVGLVSKSTETSHLTNTYSPKWNEAIYKAPADLWTKYPVTLTVKDEDTGKLDETIGKCQATLTESVLVSGAGKITNCGGKDVQQITFQFKPDP